ncbi:hypothetical protein K490DRAFT_53261 [Saccharata proteae CBS 121410]|uniref:Reticulon-like protein n=1 Tax=Saccharata proteae CBS 121410 TaxID=1314787 RepID=A0A9P4I204_9PEZI|nr:hypothetical protein K490DRAFT_53261 [Saccharata proteae CBS 121410]
MSADGAPQLPTPDLSTNNGGYVDLDPTTPAAGETTSSQANGRDTMQETKNTVLNSKNHPVTQNVMDTVQNGENVKAEGAKTQSEFRDLAGARRVPDRPAATGQPLTRKAHKYHSEYGDADDDADYHSMFYRLLSWKNPRATGISFALSILFIFAARYLNVVRYIFKGLYLVLGITAVAEVAGKAVLGNGLATQMRPRKYYMIRKESLERLLDDVEQLINFFVIEFQRILFAENIYVTVGAFFTSVLSYWLIKVVPLWGLTLLGTIAVYLGPLVYLQNKELIDSHLNQANETLSQQASQFKDLAAQHTSRATDTMKTYASEYSTKAQEMMGQAKNKAAVGATQAKETAATSAAQAQEMAYQAKEKAAATTSQYTGSTGSSEPAVKQDDFPSAPAHDPLAFNKTDRVEDPAAPVADAQLPVTS